MQSLDRSRLVLSLALVPFLTLPASAAGLLVPRGSSNPPLSIRDHHLNVVINNGFARTEVIQTFQNPNEVDLEAIYSFPLPRSASLSEVTIYSGEKEIHGEVVEKERARQAYREEREKGNDTGLAEKDGYQTLQFNVAPVRAKSDTRIRFLYYQPLEIDTGVGRYLYPLEEGGTDEKAKGFWTTYSQVDGTFSAVVELKTAWPVTEVRLPGLESEAKVEKLEPGHYRATVEMRQATLTRDLVFYYRLEDDLPGRVELLTYRPDERKPGTFLMVVTPGLDLKPLTGGADYVFVLDVSGSMEGKLHAMVKAVKDTLGQMRPADRYRVVTFNSSAAELTPRWTPATPENVAETLKKLDLLRATRGTNLFEGLSLGLRGLDDDRATSLVLVTDGVTNTGVVDPAAFRKLLKQYDIRVFTFVMGQSANWPLARTVCEASGGFLAGVSNNDDIIGQILLAKSKITYECLHDATLAVSGVKVFDATEEALGKVYRGQQLVIFGRYENPGKATVTLKARLSGEDKTYRTSFDFPAKDLDNPELERLWALSRIEALEAQQSVGLLPSEEARQGVRDLGLAYQIVTDETSMLVLSDAGLEERGIERRNHERVAAERTAEAARSSQPVRSSRVDRPEDPMFNRPAPSVGRGGGAIDPVTGAAAVALAALAVAALRRRRGERETA